MKYISTYEMVADPLTKLISLDALKKKGMLGVWDCVGFDILYI